MASELVQQTFQDLLLMLGTVTFNVAQLLFLPFEFAVGAKVRLFREGICGGRVLGRGGECELFTAVRVEKGISEGCRIMRRNWEGSREVVYDCNCCFCCEELCADVRQAVYSGVSALTRFRVLQADDLFVIVEVLGELAFASRSGIR